MFKYRPKGTYNLNSLKKQIATMPFYIHNGIKILRPKTERTKLHRVRYR